MAALDRAGLHEQPWLGSGDRPALSVAYQMIVDRLATDMARFRATGGVAPTGPVPTLTATFQPAEGLIKGTADRGQYVVACVLGDLTVAANAQKVSGGGGDCQALRFEHGNWGISPGAAAAAAPLAWPGTAEAVAAGYLQVR